MLPVSTRLGFFWLAFGLLVAPSSKVYHTVCVVLLTIPALFLIARHPATLLNAVLNRLQLWCSVVLFLCWAAISTAWGDAGDLHYVPLILLFLALFPLGYDFKPDIGLAILASFMTMQVALFYNGERFTVGQLDNAVVYGAVAAVLAVYSLAAVQHTGAALIIAALFTGCAAASGTRSAMGAEVLACMAWCLIDRSPRGQLLTLAGWTTAIAGAVAIFGFDMFNTRGISYRDLLLELAVDKASVTGLGLGVSYYLEYQSLFFAHAHNMFTDIAIRLGYVGMLLWVHVLACTVYYSVRTRNTASFVLVVFTLGYTMFDIAFPVTKFEYQWLLTWAPIGMAMVCKRRAYV